MNQKSDKWIFYPSTECDELIIDDNQEVSKYSYGLALLLIQLASFQNELEKFRDKLKIGSYFDVPDKLKYSELEDWLKSLNVDYKELFFAGDYICFLYRLPGDWQLPFMSAIVSDFLPVPIQLPPIEIYQPNNPISFKHNKFPDHLARYPALVIKKDIPVGAIRSWLDTHKSEYEQAKKGLYKDDSFRGQEETLFWGMVASLVYKDYPHIDETFQEMCHEYASHLSSTKTNFTYSELNSCRIRFEKALDKMDFLSS